MGVMDAPYGVVVRERQSHRSPALTCAPDIPPCSLPVLPSSLRLRKPWLTLTSLRIPTKAATYSNLIAATIPTFGVVL
jgi:hypothetical protein